MPNIGGIIIAIGIIIIFFPYEVIISKKVYESGGGFGEVIRNIEYENTIIKLLVKSSKKIVNLLRLNLSESRTEKIKLKIDTAGLKGIIAPDDFYSMKVGGCLYTFCFFGIILLAEFSMFNLIIAILAGILGYLAPDHWLHMKGKNRQWTITKQLPNMLSSLAVVTDAGLNLIQAVEVYVEQNQNELSDELKRVIEDIKIGIDTKEAFIAFSQRMDIEEVNYFVSALVQGFEKGNAGFSKIIKEQAKESWEKRKHKAKEMAEKASLKLFFPMLLLVFPAFLIYLIGPMIFSIIDIFGG